MFNQITLVGRLGQDPESRSVNETSVTNFSMATSESYKDKKSGETKYNTTWHRCVAWGKQGEVIAKYFSKGDPILVIGSIQKRDYEDKDGTKKQAVDVKVSGFSFLPKGDRQKEFDGTKDASAPPDVPSVDSGEELPF